MPRGGNSPEKGGGLNGAGNAAAVLGMGRAPSGKESADEAERVTRSGN
jgi:hypothetical protein